LRKTIESDEVYEADKKSVKGDTPVAKSNSDSMHLKIAQRALFMRKKSHTSWAICRKLGYIKIKMSNFI
jgi:hypothetical protein